MIFCSLPCDLYNSLGINEQVFYQLCTHKSDEAVIGLGRSMPYTCQLIDRSSLSKSIQDLPLRFTFSDELIELDRLLNVYFQLPTFSSEANTFIKNRLKPEIAKIAYHFGAVHRDSSIHKAAIKRSISGMKRSISIYREQKQLEILNSIKEFDNELVCV